MVQATDIKARGSRQELPADDPEALNRPSARVGNSRRFGNTYDAARDSRTRKSTSRTLKAEDSVLDTSDRRKLTAEARDIVRNFPEAAWCARKHLDFVASRNFQARTADSGLNKAIEAHIAWRSQPENCDLAARHPLHRMRRLAEAHAIIDGDIVWLKLADGRCQAIEGDRIRAPEYGELPPGYAASDFTHGIVTSRGGRALEFCVCRRDTNTGGFQFDRIFPAKWMLHHGYFTRYDQIRGITPLSSALTAFRDVYEGRTYALAKSKVAQFFGLAITRKGSEPLGMSLTGAPPERRDYADEINLSDGPQVIDMDPDEEAKFLENRTPSTEFQEFDRVIVASALKSLDIPYSFHDESFTNFYGSRAALQHYLYSAKQKRANLDNFMDNWTQWQLGMAVANGELKLPRTVAFEDLNWQWVPDGMPWWKPLDEIQAYAEAIRLGLTSTQRVCTASGEDAIEILDEEVAYLIARAERAKTVHAAGGRMPDEAPPLPVDPNSPEGAALAEQLNGAK